MIAYIVRRLILCVIVLILVTLLVFLIMRILPSDPLTLFLAQSEIQNLPPDTLLALKQEYGLDKTLPMQYFDWIGGVLHGDLGKSISQQNKVSTLIADAMPISLHLGIISFVISSILGIVFGIICALRRGKWLDTFITVLANMGITLPSFWVGIMLIYVFGYRLEWLPIYGYTSPFTDFWLNTRQIIMPVICLSLFSVAGLTRQTRSSVLEVVQQDYIRTAWSKGLEERIIAIRHIIKNALIPIVTILGMHAAFIIAGSVVIETVFNIQGLGRLLASAVFAHDYQIVQAGALIVATIVVLVNLTVDILYSWIDPRIRYQ